jgi:DNA-binding winged helix-turn-helix (wHTH) protein
MAAATVEQSLHFRQEEVAQLYDLAKAGESASVIGVSGVGKSNFFNHLLDPAVQEQYLGAEASSFFFVRVNFHYLLDFNIRSVLSLLLEQLILLEEHKERLALSEKLFEQLNQYHEALIGAQTDLLKVRHAFSLALRALLGYSQRRLVFLFDQFDEVIGATDSRLLTLLRGLRETYKYRIVYIAFTRNILTPFVISEPAREEFYELLAANIVGLRPYNRHDAREMADRIAKRNNFTIANELFDPLFVLSGGHSGLLRAILLAVRSDVDVLAADADARTRSLLQNGNIKTECTKIWGSLSVEEQQLLATIAHEGKVDQDNQATSLMKIKGILLPGPTGAIFSTLFHLFVQNQERVWEKSLHLDEMTRRVWVLGKVMPTLTLHEFRLFHYLYAHLDEAVDKDRLADAAWPEAAGDVSDQALTSAIYRLRKKIEPDPKNPRYILNERDFGYRLTAD